MRKRPATLAAHPPEPVETASRAIAPPITPASVYRFPDLDALLDASKGRAPREGFYRRYGNPNGRQLEEAVAALEGAEEALACTSGMAACHALFGSLLRRGDRVAAASDLYGGTTAFLRDQLPRLGIEVVFEPLESLERGIPAGTAMVAVESISNPLCRVADLGSLSRACRKGGALLVVDNTFATPVLCRPLERGADLVWHSGTKFLNGHGDAVSGIVCGPAPRIARARALAIGIGGTISPLDAWLTLRGMKTLDLRMRKSCANAERLSARLARHPAVKAVHYPGRNRHLEGGRGAIFSFELKGGLAAADRFVRGCRLAALAPSLGDVTTTLSHPARSSHAYLGAAERAAMGVTDGLIRVSTGIEDPKDLLEDFERALGARGRKR